jgi:hypothetical protein
MLGNFPTPENLLNQDWLINYEAIAFTNSYQFPLLLLSNLSIPSIQTRQTRAKM